MRNRPIGMTLLPSTLIHDVRRRGVRQVAREMGVAPSTLSGWIASEAALKSIPAHRFFMLAYWCGWDISAKRLPPPPADRPKAGRPTAES